MVSRRDAPDEDHHNNTTIATGLIPLLTYVENLESDIHQHPSDERVTEIIKDNFSPHLLVDEDTTLLGFNAFKEFNTTFRDKFFALRIVDRKPVVFKSDKDGKAGVVGFATSWLFEQKKDRALFDGDTMTSGVQSEIFEVTWHPDIHHPSGGFRQVTKAFAVIGTMNRISQPRQREKKPSYTKHVQSNRVSKRNSRSKVN